ncbi:MAG: ACT domain-containing protein [bacterium]
MEESKIIITIIGIDKVGIVASFANVLSKYHVNIEDIRQTIMQDYFAMIMMADISKSTSSFQELKENLSNAGAKMDMEVWVQRKKIFDKMHSI